MTAPLFSDPEETAPQHVHAPAPVTDPFMAPPSDPDGDHAPQPYAPTGS